MEVSEDQMSTKRINKETTKESSDSNSAALLKHAFDKSINRSLSTLTTELFAKAYPTVYKHDKSRIRELRKSTKELLLENTREEMDLILREFSVEEKLSELDEAIKQFKSTGKKWRPAGDAERDIRAHLMEVKLEHIKELKQILKAECKVTRELEINNAKTKENLNKLVIQTNEMYNDFMTNSNNK